MAWDSTGYSGDELCLYYYGAPNVSTLLLSTVCRVFFGGRCHAYWNDSIQSWQAGAKGGAGDDDYNGGGVWTFSAGDAHSTATTAEQHTTGVTICNATYDSCR